MFENNTKLIIIIIIVVFVREECRVFEGCLVWTPNMFKSQSSVSSSGKDDRLEVEVEVEVEEKKRSYRRRAWIKLF